MGFTLAMEAIPSVAEGLGIRKRVASLPARLPPAQRIATVPPSGAALAWSYKSRNSGARRKGFESGLTLQIRNRAHPTRQQEAREHESHDPADEDQQHVDDARRDAHAGAREPAPAEE